MRKKLSSLIVTIACLMSFGVINGVNNTYATSSLEDYATLTDVNKGTFNEYRYYILNEYFNLKNQFETNGKMSTTTLANMAKYAKTSYNYTKQNLINKNLLNEFLTSIQKGLEEPSSEVYYTEIIDKMDSYIQDVRIDKLTGNIRATPSSGNAPLSVTLNGNITDPSGTTIPAENYTWRIDKAGVKTVIGTKKVINYTFREEGNFTVFLDVKSSHKNELGYIDTLPFSSTTLIKVDSKVASLIIKVNDEYLLNGTELKFTPEEASYGLIFDATASSPTGGAKFTKTTWDFGNGVERENDGEPVLERVVYSKEGTFTVELKIKTNEGNTITKKFYVTIHNPIATISVADQDGYIGDTFKFSTTTSTTRDLTYSWTIIDSINDKVLEQKSGTVLDYVFTKKGKYTIKLDVSDAAGNTDVDTKTININSRPPVASFLSSIPYTSKPSMVLLDGTKSYDQDFSDLGNLKYEWLIDGQKAVLDNLDSKGAIGYYTFDSIGDHSVSLEVTDLDGLNNITTGSVKINSILTADFTSYPKAVKVGTNIKFVAGAPEAKYYEWTFGDGVTFTTNDKITNHTFEKSGNFDVKLKVIDENGNSNTITNRVYVGKSDYPIAVLNFEKSDSTKPVYNARACSNGAYTIDRVSSIVFNGDESVNTDGNQNGLSYAWKIGNGKILTGKNINYKFSELGCYNIKLTVTDEETGKSYSDSIWLNVENLKPQLSTLNISAVNLESDPVVVNLTAIGATDLDGVIQSYLWYYYTDTDPDPQDYRITKLPNTSFVLPKIQGNYHFVLVMKDNNEDRYTSTDGDSSNYFITLTGDNINTPLIDLKVNKSSLNVGDEVIFSSTAKNVLGEDISNKVEYTWDFDGDGFYDKETNIGSISYIYKEAGTYYAKLRVKYKGMTNVRTVEINVANILKPDFEYVSIGNKYLFFNTSKGDTDRVVFDMGDGNKISDKDYFEYTYEDNEKSHDVNLKIIDGTNIKETTKTVYKDMKNLLKSQTSSGAAIYSDLGVSGNKITVTEKSDKAILYVDFSNENGNNSIKIDTDLTLDSDLNGAIDDDLDVEIDESSFVEILLSDAKKQLIRVSTYEGNEIVSSVDYVFTKDYIEENDIDINSLEFNGVSDNEKVKIETLKNYITNLPSENRLKAMEYVQKLQEEWFYDTEKTKVILDFTQYIDTLNLSNGEEIIELLESFLVQDQEDKSVRNMSYNVVKNLIPKELVEYNDLILNLDTIKENPSNIEDNRILGKEILEGIKDTSLIKSEDKLTIKAQLQVLIYGGVDNIPEEQVKEVKETVVKKSSSSKIIGIFKGVIFFLIGIIGVIFGIIFVLFIWYKLFNKNEKLGFQDFIIERFNGKSVEPKKEEKKLPVDDFDDFETKKVEQKNQKSINNLNNSSDQKTSIDSKSQPKNEISKNQNQPQGIKNEKPIVPDWLKASGVKIEEDNSVTKKVNNDSKLKKSDKKIPDWLNNKDENTKKSDNKDLNNPETKKTLNNNEVKKVPDWLKGIDENNIDNSLRKDVKESNTNLEKKDENINVSKVEVLENKNPETPKNISETSKIKSQEAKKEVIKETTKVEEEVELPDWLKGGEETQVKETKKEVTKEAMKVEEEVELPDWLKGGEETQVKEAKKEVIKETTKVEEEVELPDWLKGGEETQVKETKKEVIKETMKVEEEVELPDWLKGGEETQVKETKKEVTKEAMKVEEEVELPDWLKGGEETQVKETKKPQPTKKVEEKKPETKKPQPTKKVEEKKPEAKKPQPTKKVEEKKPEAKKPQPTKKVEEKKSEAKKPQPTKKVEEKKSEAKKDELWGDGMDIPEWLKDEDKK